MFGIGFWELSFILLLGLLVLGPERLPRAIRTVGFYWRKMRTLAISAQQQIERELDAEELRRYLEQQTRLPDDSTESADKTDPPANPDAKASSAEHNRANGGRQ